MALPLRHGEDPMVVMKLKKMREVPSFEEQIGQVELRVA